MPSLADYIFVRQAKYIYFVVILLSASLGFITYKWYLGHELSFVNGSISSMNSLSNEIAREIGEYTYAINLATGNDKSLITNSPHALRKIFYSVGINSQYMYGVGYFWDPKIYNYGEYLYESDNQQFIVESMNEIYERHNTAYYLRPWFTEVMSTESYKIYSPQSSWTGESNNLLTYAFPIFWGKSIVGVGIYDISMKYFEYNLNKLRGLSTSHHNKNLSIYYVSLPYGSLHQDNLFYDINSTKAPIADRNIINQLNSAIYSGGFQILGWRYHGWRVYRVVSLLDNSLVMIVEYNLKKVFLLTCLWLAITIICLKILLIRLKRTVVHQLAIIVNPISEISSYTSMLAKKDLDFSFRHYQNNEIQEVSRLGASLEKMRNNLQQLMVKELELEKSTAELRLAAKLQGKMIPFTFEQQIISETDLSIVARFVPAHVLSGDLYDIVILSQDIYILIGDATGKNITAAFFSLFVLGRFRMLCQNQLPPSQILDDLNNYLCNTDAENMFISAICLRVDLQQQMVTFSNAGHEMPIVINRDNLFLHIENPSPDLVLGIIPDIGYKLYHLPEINTLGHVVVITDGITEARSPDNGQLLGVDVVQSLVGYYINQNLTAKEICDQLLIECCNFEKSQNLSDDRTIVVMKLE